LECSTGRCTWKARRRDSRLAHADPELAGYLRIEERELEAGALSRIPAPERVFCHPEKGSVLDHKRYAETFRAALVNAQITDYVPPFHDSRHSAITNDAAAGNSGLAVMKRAGHSDSRVTQQYLDLAGVDFAEEAERAAARAFAHVPRSRVRAKVESK
jgi:integrase